MLPIPCILSVFHISLVATPTALPTDLLAWVHASMLDHASHAYRPLPRTFRNHSKELAAPTPRNPCKVLMYPSKLAMHGQLLRRRSRLLTPSHAAQNHWQPGTPGHSQCQRTPSGTVRWFSC